MAYLVNQYPKVSHSFIRREILALERLGVGVDRFALRGWDADVADAADRAERERTRYVLAAGLLPLAAAAVSVALRSVGRFFGAARLAVRMARRSDRSLAHHLVYLAEACCLVGWLRSSGSTHLHAHFGTNSAEVAMLAHALGGPPYSFTVHGPEEFDRAAAIGLPEKIRRAAFVVAISSFGRSQLFRWAVPADWAKMHVVHCGLEPAFFAASGSEGASAAPQRIVCVGRLCEQKGQLLLVQALGRIVAEGAGIELVLAGDGEMRGAVEHSVRALGLAGRVRITGWISSDEVMRELLGARALVLPSFAEGLPVVIMEAMACRRPVLSTYVAGIPELVRDGIDGWLFPAGDVDALAAAMRACMAAAPAALAQMGESGRQRVLARHAADTEAAKLARLFRGLPAASEA